MLVWTSKRLGLAILSITFLALPVSSQVRVELSKSTRPIPKECKLVQPAVLEPQIDIDALVKEAMCKGAGEMLSEYTYTMDVTSRLVDKKGKSKTRSNTYEVFLPTLKAGTQARGILVETAKNGVPVPPDKLAKERREAGEKLEKEETRIEREAPPVNPTPNRKPGMAPIGSYSRTSVGRDPVDLAFTISSFLKTCDFSFLRREIVAGRPNLIFTFVPRAGASFNEGEGYIAQLTGEIAIDVEDRIVTKLSAWPTGVEQTAPPAVFQDMTRLKDDTWLPRLRTVNAAIYPTLSDKVNWDWSATFSNYLRFVTEIKDVRINKSPD
jgi:hypothetical protein